MIAVPDSDRFILETDPLLHLYDITPQEDGSFLVKFTTGADENSLGSDPADNFVANTLEELKDKLGI